MDETSKPIDAQGAAQAPAPGADAPGAGAPVAPGAAPAEAAAPTQTAEERAAILARNAWIRAADAALEDVRRRSREGKLTTQARWRKRAEAPAGEDQATFADELLSYIEEHEHAEDTPALGRMTVPEPPAAPDAPASADGDAAQVEPLPEPDVSDLVLIYGKRAVYLYSKPLMSHSFAHALFMTAEDDDLATFAEVVRTESREYPRPVAASIFMNPPYLWSVDKTVGLFEQTIDNEAYQDICITQTSMGESYFYSDRYLSAAQGKALAEWYGVEKGRNP